MKRAALKGVLLAIATTVTFSATSIAGTPVSTKKIKIARQHIEQVTPQKAYEMKGVVFVDVRSYVEYKKGHIPHAIWAPRGLLDFKALKWFPDKSKTYIVYCKTGGRGSISTYDMVQLGYKAYNLKGGFLAWKKAGLPIEKGEPKGLGKAAE
ncbi:rhodanese-like domain-containing protein [Hippea jasoniae]|uniref:rhodanese-like domain-containing protein n=1 Tax=Hippea jasoniae TaxID=944479 RepID=UPI000689BB0A|nr:rhodanese-like domain-containing protein [Hippea jasoniae]